MKIGILGGSFDPVHAGHLSLARESEAQFKLDKILFIPARIPPHKQEDPSLAPASHRARMVELAISGAPRWELSDLELRRPGVSYTVETLLELRKIYPEPHQIFFIVGADSLADLKKWKDPEEILRLSEWIVAPRPAFPLPGKLPPRMHWLKMAPLSLSASELREKIQRGDDVSQWVPQKVTDYIRRTGLYRREGA
ncbi:MAG: nicotinate (nicotinamide) nucleotide adenylyltransferase [Candidatus Omnitrophica bacterium]|nr:nicotinate (nicotinamide) nucleotide adenylyltransferase [Candidatus Omnitrophota bacterium]